jgi:RHS repeat-associated protein
MVDELLAQENLQYDAEEGKYSSTPDDLFWILPDRLSSVGDAINASGTVRIHNQYDAFGTEYQTLETYGGSIADENIPRYGYTCQEKEPLIAGLLYYNARWYDTGTGRFLSEDSLGFNAGYMNLYVYCGNNSVNLTDPTGLCSGWSSYGVTSTSQYLQNIIGPTSGSNWNAGINISGSDIHVSNWIMSGPSVISGNPNTYQDYSTIGLNDIIGYDAGSNWGNQVSNFGGSGVPAYSENISSYTPSVSTPRYTVPDTRSMSVEQFIIQDIVQSAREIQAAQTYHPNYTPSPILEGAKGFGLGLGQVVLNMANAVTDIPADIDNAVIGIYNNAIAPIGNAITDPVSSFIPASNNGPLFPQVSYYENWNWSQSKAVHETDFVHNASVNAAKLIVPLVVNKLTKLAQASRLKNITEVPQSEFTTAPIATRILARSGLQPLVSDMPELVWNNTRILGKAQNTMTPGHAKVIARQVKNMAESGEYEYITLNRSWKVTTGLENASGRRPDIIGVRRNGLVDAFEIKSKSDTKASLTKRLQEGMNTLPTRNQGSVHVLHITGE